MRNGAAVAHNLACTMRVLAGSFVLQAKDRVTSNFFIGTLFIQPVILTVLAVGTYHYGGREDFTLFAVIGAGMIGIWNANLWTSGNIVRDERRGGTLALLLASPTTFPVVLVGKSLSNALASFVAVAITLLTGMLAFGVVPRFTDPLGFVISLLLTLVAMTCLGLILGSAFVLTRNTGDFMNVANYPIFILSGLSFPLTLLPAWTRPLSTSLAPTWGNLAMNSALGMIESNPWTGYLWLTGLSLVYLLIARVLFRKVEHQVRQAGNLEEW
jgi:ABC-2 type transport system permease protein